MLRNLNSWLAGQRTEYRTDLERHRLGYDFRSDIIGLLSEWPHLSLAQRKDFTPTTVGSPGGLALAWMLNQSEKILRNVPEWAFQTCFNNFSIQTTRVVCRTNTPAPISRITAG